MLRLHHADGLEPLLDSLAAVIGAPTEDPFAPDLVVVPSHGMADAVVAGLAQRVGVSSAELGDGVMANLSFVFPGQFIARVLGDTAAPGGHPETPWQVEQLTWAVLDVMTLPGVTLPRQPESTELWSFARSIADHFDRYAIQRPQMVQQWAAPDGGLSRHNSDSTTPGDGTGAPLLAAHVWQHGLWRAIRSRMAVPSPPERLPTLLERVRSGEIASHVPGRIVLFGFGTLSSGLLEVARAVAARREVHAFLRHPSAAAWNGSPRLAGVATLRSAEDVAAHVKHPLLSSWGRSSLEAAALLNGCADVEQVAAPEPAVPDSTTALRALQRQIRLNQVPQRVDEVVSGDGSVQVHACHGDVRQLEVLRDALGHAFVADPTLAAHEVVIVSPRLEDFAPHIESVFSRGSLPIPVVLSDRSLSSSDPLGDALVVLLDMLSGRVSLSEMLGLLQHPAMGDLAGWDVEAVQRVSSWAAELGARWGLDAGHRVKWHLPGEITTGTWRAVVDRLMLGVAMPAETPRLAFAGLSPHDAVGTEEALVAGRLADLVDRMLAAHARLAGSRPIAEWVEALHEITDLFLVDRKDEPWARRGLHRMLDSLVEAATIDGVQCGVDLTLDDVVRMLRRSIAERPGRLYLRSGAVTVTSLVAVQGIPARVLCILGLDDGAVRSGAFDGDDILGINPCVGERHPRYESRQQLLDALLSAGDRLIITCTGSDLTTNKPVPFIVPLVELLDAIDIVTGDHQVAVVRHPRHGFNERALRPGVLFPPSAQSFTFDTAMLTAALARADANAGGPEPQDRWLLPPAGLDTFDVDLLVGAVMQPARVYLSERLEVRLPSSPSSDENGLSIGAGPLDNSGLGWSLIATRRTGGSTDEWVAATRQDGTLPPAHLGEYVIQQVVSEVRAIEAAAESCEVPLAGADALAVDHSLGPLADEGGVAPGEAGAAVRRRVIGLIDGVHTAGDMSTIVDIGYRRPNASQRLGLAVRLAVAELTQPTRRWRGLLVTRGATSADPPESIQLTLRGGTDDRERHATALVNAAVQMAEWSMRDAVPLFGTASEHLARGNLSKAAAALEPSYRDPNEVMLWPQLSLGLLFADAVRESDPDPVRALAASGQKCRAECTASWIWGVFDAAVVETLLVAAAADAPAEARA